MYNRRKFWHRRLLGLALVFGATIWAFTAAAASAQGLGEEQIRRGEQKFQQICVSCHTIGAGVKIGPDLQGVTERREESWLKLHILSPSVQHEQNDPISIANREKYGLQMPDLRLKEQQVEDVIAYLTTAVPAPTVIPTEYAPTLITGVLVIVGLTLLGLRAGKKEVEVRP